MSKILKKIKQNSIPLDKFIDACLYKFSDSYYEKNTIFGRRGDFITSPYISSIFGEIIAIHIINYFFEKKIDKFTVLEIGAGEGVLARDIISTISKFKQINFSYKILEKSKKLKSKQKQICKFKNIKWVNSLKKISSQNTFVISNELIDAFPIKQLKKINNVWHEKFVNIDHKKNKVCEIYKKRPQSINKVKKYVQKNNNFIEYSPQIFSFVKEIVRIVNIKNNCFLTIDYGYSDKKFFNTIQGLKGHKKNNIFEDIGQTDITHLVNFNFLKSLFKDLGDFQYMLTSQSSFLKANGIIERLNQSKKYLETDKKKKELEMAVDRLINEKKMGDLFKVFKVYK